jgi:hypothetical protein
MVAWVVIVSRHSRRSPLSFSPRSHSHFGTHPSPIPVRIAPFFSCTYNSQISQVFSFHIHACNGGGTPPPRRSDVQTSPIPISSLDATLMNLPSSVANKRLTAKLNHLDATLTKNRGYPRSGLPTIKEGEMGTGARGAPVPEVGFYVKIKRAQSRRPGSRPNEGRVNSP